MNFTIPLGIGGICVIISYIAFRNDEIGLGFLFLITGLIVALGGSFLSGKRRQPPTKP